MARGSSVSRGVLWEVLAPVIRWPLRSPARLGLVLLAVMALLVGLSHLSGGGSTRGTSPVAATTSGGWQPPTSTWSPRASTTTTTSAPAATAGSTSLAAAPAQAVRPMVSPAVVASRFVTAWARPALPAATWLPGVTSLATPAFGTSLKSVDPANVPGTRLVGAPKVKTQTPAAATVEATTDRAVVMVSLVPFGTSWKVSGVRPVRMLRTTPGAGESIRATYTPLPAGS